jgi:eukaryotic-like serine/threonine-protein kinase
LAIFQSLDKADPNNPKIRRLLALVYERIGTMHEQDGNIVSARENYLESQAIREWLASNAPENTEFVRDLAIAHEKIGNVMIAMGNLSAALESRRKSLEIFSRLAKADPGNVQGRQSLAISYMHLGELYGDPDAPNLGQRAEATKNYRAAMEILKALKESDPSDTKTQTTIDRINGLMQRL